MNRGSTKAYLISTIIKIPWWKRFLFGETITEIRPISFGPARKRIKKRNRNI